MSPDRVAMLVTACWQLLFQDIFLQALQRRVCWLLYGQLLDLQAVCSLSQTTQVRALMHATCRETDHNSC